MALEGLYVPVNPPWYPPDWQFDMSVAGRNSGRRCDSKATFGDGFPLLPEPQDLGSRLPSFR
jgi:hypothetical protein